MQKRFQKIAKEQQKVKKRKLQKRRLKNATRRGLLLSPAASTILKQKKAKN